MLLVLCMMLCALATIYSDVSRTCQIKPWQTTDRRQYCSAHNLAGYHTRVLWYDFFYGMDKALGGYPRIKIMRGNSLGSEGKGNELKLQLFIIKACTIIFYKSKFIKTFKITLNIYISFALYSVLIKDYIRVSQQSCMKCYVILQ